MYIRELSASDQPQYRLEALGSSALSDATVIVHKLDRFFRRARLLIEAVEQFEAKEVHFVSFSEQIDFSTPVGRMILTNLAGFAEFYSRNLSQETSKGKREKAQQGGWVGPIPIGYEKSPTGDLVPSADAPAVQRIFELYATRQHSYTSLADELNAAGAPTLVAPAHVGASGVKVSVPSWVIPPTLALCPVGGNAIPASMPRW